MALPKTVFRYPDFIYFAGLPSSRVFSSFIREELVSLHNMDHSMGRRGQRKRRVSSFSLDVCPEWPTSLLFTSDWPEFSYKSTSRYKEGWEI